MSAEAVDLPRWPFKGNRRRLEEQWLEELERRGLTVSLPESASEAPQELGKATGEFNSGLFWDCHESLEEVWRGTPYPQRFFYHAVIKAAVGFHHLRRHNRHGAYAKLSDSVRLLRLLPQVAHGVRTDRLLRDASDWLARLEAQGSMDWTELDAIPAPRIVG